MVLTMPLTGNVSKPYYALVFDLFLQSTTSAYFQKSASQNVADLFFIFSNLLSSKNNTFSVVSILHE